jgi:hypothetical protein
MQYRQNIVQTPVKKVNISSSFPPPSGLGAALRRNISLTGSESHYNSPLGFSLRSICI